jgi:hypothetical protein
LIVVNKSNNNNKNQMNVPLQQPAPPVDGQVQAAARPQPPTNQQQPRHSKPWKHSHPADRLAKSLSVAFSKVPRKWKNPIKAMKDRKKEKREKKDAQYRQALQSIFERGWPLAKEHHEEVVHLLRKKPFLAAESFHESVSGHSTSPLSYLIAGAAKLEMIKEVYRMSPEAIYRAWPEDTYPPLMGACHSGAAHDVIGFLTQEFPGALYKKDFDGSLPINIYMRRSPNGPTFEVIKQMVDLYPESIIVDDRIGWGLSPIDYALRLNFDIRILQYFIDRWPKQENDYGLFWDSGSDFYPDTISMERIKILMSLLPELDYFHSFIDEWLPEGLIYVMDQIRDNNTVLDLCLRVPAHTLLSDEKVIASLLRLLRENKNIQKLTLLGTRAQMRNGQQDDDYFNAILEAIEANPSLQELNLSDFNLKRGDGLAKFFLTGKAPRILTFTDIYVSDGWTAPVLPKGVNACRTEKFTISYCNIYMPWYQGFLNQLQNITSMKEFILHNGTSLNLNVTTLLVDMLTHSPLMSLKVTGYQVHMRRVAEALKDNKHLIKYSAESSVNLEWKRALIAKVMEDHNTTLEWVDLPDPKSRNGVQGQRLAYYSLLNQYGRRQIRSITKAEELIDLIVDVNEDTKNLQDIAQHNILYGLLQERPGFWSGLNFEVEEKKHSPTIEEIKEGSRVVRIFEV